MDDTSALDRFKLKITISDIIAIFALLVSGYAVKKSGDAVNEARKLTYQSQLSELKTTAMRDYATAYGDFVADLDSVNLKISLNINSPKIVQVFSDDEVTLLANVSADSFKNYRKYTTAINSATLQWSASIQIQIIRANHLANVWARCYNAMALNPTPKNKDYYQYQRQEIASQCDDAEEAKTRFVTQSQQVIGLMVADIQETWKEQPPS